MSQIICKLCLFKSETPDEVFIEEAQQLKVIIDDIFHKMVSLTKLELDGICSPCREKLKNYHEYYKFVLENQKTYEKSLGSRLFEVAKEKDQTEFIFIKEEVEEIKEPRVDSPQKEELEDWNDSTPPHGDESDEEKPVAQKRRKFSKGKRSQKPRSYMVALQKQQSDFIATLFDFKCFLCAKEPDLESYRKVVTHYKQEHRKAKTWKCCGKEMTFSIDLIEHVMDHKGTKWNCLPCGSLYKTAVELWTHQNEVHLEPSKIAIQNPVEWLKLHFICDFCGEKFRTRGFIARHLKDVHIRNHTCYICAAKFYNKKVYATHRRTEHSTVLKIPCPLCGVILKNEARHLSAHMKNMHNKQSLICPICGKVCKNDHAMKVHTIMEHKPRKHTCQYCDKKFKTANHLKDHEAIHTGISRYFCEICGAPFKSVGNYSAHKRRLHPMEYQQQKLERKAKKYVM